MNDAPKRRVLVVDDDPGMLDWLVAVLQDERCEVTGAPTGAAATRLVDSWMPCVIVTDMRLPDVDGIEVLRRAREAADPPEVLVLTGHGSVSDAVRAMQGGAHTFLEKPVDPDALRAIVDRALEHYALRRENRRLRDSVASTRREGIVGQAPAIRELLDTVARVAPSEANCLILGENGTGKELVANAIHAASARAKGPFIKINCAAIPAELIESELFGHRKGAFTGAFTDKVGLFELANGGSLLLDEIGDMPAYLQSKLMRVLQEREYRPVGSPRVVRIDVRLMCSTNVRIEEALESGRLRLDLYFRINTITLSTPPLRERVDDIPLLVEHFLDTFRRRYDKDVRRVSSEAMARLQQHRWPGNVRELENVIERATVLAKGSTIGVSELPDTLVERPKEPDAPPPLTTLAAIERMALLQALEHTNWNKQEAAHLLGLYRPTLYSKMRRHAIENRRPVTPSDESACSAA